MPLNRTQQAEIDRRRADWPAWWGSRPRRVALAVGVTLALLVASTASLLQSDHDFTLVAFAVSGLVGVALVVKACIAPERALKLSVRAQVPSDETLRRGASRFQIDGGRVPPRDEKPAGRYWDKWK